MAKRILYITKDTEYKEDLETEFMLNSGKVVYDLECTDNIEEIEDLVNRHDPDLIVVNAGAIKEREDWELGKKVCIHARAKSDIEKCKKTGFQIIGPCNDEINLIMAMNELNEDEDESEEDEIVVLKPANKPTKKGRARKFHEPENDENEEDDDIDEVEEIQEDSSLKRKNKDNLQNKTGSRTKRKKEEIIEEEEDDEYDEYEDEEDGFDEDPASVKKQKTEIKKESYSSRKNRIYDEIDDDEEEEEEENRYISHSQKKKISSRNKTENSKQKAENKGKRKEQINVKKKTYEEEYEDPVTEEFKKDIGAIKSKTKVVTIYSAKGGVGKTTIASELAVFLSKVKNQKDNLRVCIVDYNIDFGDVRATLALKSDAVSLTDWCEEVQELIKKGENPEDIYYSKEEIEEYLLMDKKNNLYVLAAPATNEDSMEIESESLEIILRNLILNGGFDYIICDTGNNTRDSTMIALDFADIILMIMTQNVNTAQCDKAFLRTMKAIDFDTSNVKMIINNIMPTKSTSITVEEILEVFPEYECVGKIKFNTDVIKATNEGTPLVNDPSHEFTKQIREVAAYVLENNEILNEPEEEKKQGFFAKLFKKKK